MASSQLADSEAMTATMLLRRIRDECAGDKPPPPLQLVTQLADVLTRRLLDTQPELLNTSLNAESNCCDTLIMHRNYMETTTLSVAAANQSAWSALRTLIYPGGGADINTYFAASIIPPVEMASNVADGGTKLSFWQLSERVRKKGYGVLVGWRRVPRAESKAKKGRIEQAKEAAKEMAKAAAETASAIVKDAGGGSKPGGVAGSKASLLQKEKTVANQGGERGILELNPADKDRLLAWKAADLLVVIAPDDENATANGDLIDVQADAGKRQTAANVMRSQTAAKGDLNAVLAGGHKSGIPARAAMRKRSLSVSESLMRSEPRCRGKVGSHETGRGAHVAPLPPCTHSLTPCAAFRASRRCVTRAHRRPRSRLRR